MRAKTRREIRALQASNRELQELLEKRLSEIRIPAGVPDSAYGDLVNRVVQWAGRTKYSPFQYELIVLIMGELKLIKEKYDRILQDKEHSK